MLNKKILIILLLKLHLALALNSANFCTIKQKVCKGYYDTKQNYQTKCGLVECSDERFSFKCSNDICTNNKTECFKYKKLKSNIYFQIGKQAALNPMMKDQYLEEISKFQMFKMNIQVCDYKIYKFDRNYFCVNGLNCVEKFVSPTALGYNYVRRKIACKCPNKKEFKCGKYCTKDSIACDLFKSNKTLFVNINNCGNNDVSIFRSFFHFN